MNELQLLDRNQDLIAAQATRESEYESALSDERGRRQQLSEEVRALRDQVEASTGAVAQPEYAEPDSSLERRAPESDLEPAQIEAQELRWKLEDAEYRCRVMAETLGHLGVTVDMKLWPPSRPQEGAEPCASR